MEWHIDEALSSNGIKIALVVSSFFFCSDDKYTEFVRV